MFWDDQELETKKQSRLRVPPPIPATQWRPPSNFPNLSSASVISFDVETKERDFDHGPGWGRGKSHIVGFSIAARAGRSKEPGKWYFPIRHEVEGSYNVDANQALGWLKEQLETETPKVGANLIFDIGSLGAEGINVKGKLHDVQFAEALLDEKGDTNLDWLGYKYLKQRKTSDELYAWLSQAYGGAASGKQRENIYRAPPLLVGPYGEDDADLPLRIFEAQHPLLAKENLLPLFDMENRLIPLLVKMRRQGVRIDLDYADKLYTDLGHDITRMMLELGSLVGKPINPDSPIDLEYAFRLHGITFPRTAPTEKHPNGQPSFTKEYLKALNHPIASKINEIRELKKLKSTFVKGYLLESNTNGLIHCSFHPLRNADDGDSSGTKTGRFSSDKPNLQNIPVRSEAGKKIRKAFIAHAGHSHWRKFDYSQIEYRMLAHFAVNETGGVSADQLRAEYNADPTTDYHNRVMISFAKTTGVNLDAMDKDARETFRKPIKNVNFGLLYGQTEKALAHKAGMTREQAATFFSGYHATSPYVRATMKAIEAEVQQYGFVRTITDRRTRFDEWQPAGFGEKGMPLPYRSALAEYGGNIKRAWAYRGVNYKLQGSAADVIKIAMDAANRAGVFDVIGVPLLQVHDELDFSVIDESPAQIEAYAYLRHILENSIKLKVPVKVDCTEGLNWGLAR